MSKIKNYSILTDQMLNVFEAVENDSMPLEKAMTLISASNAVINIQRIKILSTRVTGEKEIKFFKD